MSSKAFSMRRFSQELAKNSKFTKPDAEKCMFKALDQDTKGYIYKKQIIDVLYRAGINKHFSAAETIFEKLSQLSDGYKINFDTFVELTKLGLPALEKALTGKFVIPNFQNFCQEIEDVFRKTEKITEGEVASYIPQLARMDPGLFSVSICTVDGQMFSLGDKDSFFSVQSTCKPINYCLIQEEHDEDYVHRWIGKEPSGHRFNVLRLNKNNMPHNPFINAGAIAACSLIRRDLDPADKFDYVMDTWRELCGGFQPRFNNAVYLSERNTGNKNFAIAYFMKEKKALPEETNIIEILEFYFQCCALEVNTQGMSVLAATMANAGVCPLTQRRIFSPTTVKNCLSLLLTCGLYDFSGEFAFSVGLPAKSGVSGAFFLVIPDVMGISIFSPLLDAYGNSIKAVAFSKYLIEKFNFHNYDSIMRNTNKNDPRRLQNETKLSDVMSLIWAATQGDLTEIKRLIALGVDLSETDYDKRTALHLAASEGHVHVVKFLIAQGVPVNPIDRWGGTPLADALRSGHTDVVKTLMNSGAKANEKWEVMPAVNEELKIPALLNNYPILQGNFDEYFSAENKARTDVINLFASLEKYSTKQYQILHDRVKERFSEKGITFKANTHKDDVFPFDLLPRIVQKKEWHNIEKGLLQRVHALNLFLDDIYEQQKIMSAFPQLRELILSCKEYLPQLRFIRPLGGTRVHVAGCDLIRNVDGKYYCLEDNLKVPSGVSYILENRNAIEELMPDWMDNYEVAAVRDYPKKLKEYLASLSNRDKPKLALLTPGPYNSAYFEHKYLAEKMDCALVENSALFAENDYLYWQSPQGKQRIDVLYRRTNDEFLDPTFFRADSLLGVAGIVDVYKKGNIVLANALGNGVADDKAIYHFVPQMIRFYLDEEPILPQIKTYLGADKKEYNYIMTHLAQLVVKAVNQSGGAGMLIGPQASSRELDEFRQKIKASPRSYIAQPLIELSTIPTYCGQDFRPHRVDFRTFVLTGANNGNWALPGGLSRVALKDGSYIVNSCQGGGSKDTWIVD